ncbi:MAG: OmpH family outer membrane protein [Chitinophagaceae bacterium]|nr:OmpH family outer membrane protein [Chitinophagaceae bacterium]
MKNFLPISVAVLAVCVVILFVLQFKNNGSSSNSLGVNTKDSSGFRPLRVAYVDLDSIQEKFVYYKSKMIEFEKKKELADRDLNSAYQQIQNEGKAFQQRGNSITQAEGEAFQRDYTRKMQNLEEQKRIFEGQIQEEGIRTMDDLRKRMNDFLLDFNKKEKYSYIFSYSSGLNVMFYKDTTYNITNQVAAGLNDAYNKSKK